MVPLSWVTLPEQLTVAILISTGKPGEIENEKIIHLPIVRITRARYGKPGKKLVSGIFVSPENTVTHIYTSTRGNRKTLVNEGVHDSIEFSPHQPSSNPC